MADFGCFGWPPPAGRMARIPRGAGPASKGKGPETFRALVIGGAGGSRTPVRKPSTARSTYLAYRLNLAPVWVGRLTAPTRAALVLGPGPSGPTRGRASVNDAARWLTPSSGPEASRCSARRPQAARAKRSSLAFVCFPVDLRGDWSSVCAVLLCDPRRSQVRPHWVCKVLVHRRAEKFRRWVHFFHVALRAASR